MSRKILLLAVSAILLPALATAAEDTTVYRTKNADGTNTYSQVETRGAEVRTINAADPASGQTAPAGARPKSTNEVACERATLNAQLLSANANIQQDKDGDGTPETLTPEEHKAQSDLAARQVEVYCNANAASPNAPTPPADAGASAGSDES
jgi:hypothetical protein